MADSYGRSRDDDDGLGSLAQSARSRQLRSARNTLYFVAGWLFVNGLVLLFLIQDRVKNAGPLVDQNAVNAAYVLTGGFIVLAILYLIFAIKIKDYPVPITITALVLYLGLHLTLAAIEPATIREGLVVKIIVIVALSKAIQAAIAYEAERKRASRYDDDYDDRPSRSSRRDDDRDDDDDDRPRSRRDDYDHRRRSSRDDDDDRNDRPRGRGSRSERDDW